MPNCVCGRPIIRVLGRTDFAKKCQGHTFEEMGFSKESIEGLAKGIAEWYTRAEELAAA